MVLDLHWGSIGHKGALQYSNLGHLLFIHAPPVKLLAPFVIDSDGSRSNEVLGNCREESNSHGVLDRSAAWACERTR